MPSSPARQVPTLAVSPSYERSDVESCAALLAETGLHLFEWQYNVLSMWLARDDTGHWASGTLGLAVPRQNGKTLGCVNPLIVYRMVVFGEWVVYTAHLQRTATETFEAIRDIFDTPALRGRVKDIKGALGREEIILQNGGRVKFLARTRNGGRGQHGDLLVFDEAQALTSSQQASFLPVISASLNPQTVYSGTPPTPEDDGHVFASIRARAIGGESKRTAWCEWSIKTLAEATLDTSWYETNPSFGVLIQESTIVSEFESMALDEFARERLGWWAPEKVENLPAIDPKEWEACAVEAIAPQEGEKVCCGVKFSPDGGIYSVGIATKRKDEPGLVELYDSSPTNRGISELARWLIERKGEFALVAIDGREWAATLVQKLADGGFPKNGVHVMRPAEIVDASAMLAGAVTERSIVHIPQPLLEQSVANSPRRLIGRDGWGFGGSDSTPVESCALAHWAAQTTKRNPKNRLRVSV